MSKKVRNKRTIRVSRDTEPQEILICGITFKKGGEFHLENKKLKVHLSRSSQHDTHIVYAHVVDSEVVYIGESSSSFQTRTKLYISHEGATNVRVREHHKKSLSEGSKIEVYYYKPTTVVVDGLVVNPYVGVEQALIAKIAPQLNRKNTA